MKLLTKLSRDGGEEFQASAIMTMVEAAPIISSGTTMIAMTTRQQQSLEGASGSM